MLIGHVSFDKQSFGQHFIGRAYRRNDDAGSVIPNQVLFYLSRVIIIRKKESCYNNKKKGDDTITVR